MTTEQPSTSRKGFRLPIRRIGKVALWITGPVAVLLLVIWAVLLVTPIPVPFVRDQAIAVAATALPDNYTIELGDTALALEGGLWPVIKITPVKLTDSDSGATIAMEALDVGFSPFRALVGQPGVTVTLVRPYLQVIQDLFGPRLAGFELVDDQEGNDATIWIMEGDRPQPSVRISSEGLNIRGALADGESPTFRSDNDWLIYNLEAMEESIAAFEQQSRMGRFSRLKVRDGRMDMHDSVYGLFRQLTGINMEVAPTALGNAIRASFGAELSGRKIAGTLRREHVDDDGIKLRVDVANLDFASLLPFVDDPDGIMALRGAGKLGIEVGYDAQTGKVRNGTFDVDLSGTSLRVQSDLFPVTTEDVRIEWDPAEARFDMRQAQLRIGQSTGVVNGVFVMGLDDTYGPTLSMSVQAESVVIHPNDMPAPEHAFEVMAFSGWSAPLYGAIGVDQLVAQREDVQIRVKGRADMLRSGIGFEMEVGGTGATADDLKRLWPYFLSPIARDWFVTHVTAGKVIDSAMRFNFPVGTISMSGEDKPVPPGALSIDMTGVGVSFTPMDDMQPVAVSGNVRVNVTDNVTTVNLDGASLETSEGPVSVGDAAFIIDNEAVGSSLYEISGNVGGDIPALLALAEERSPGALDNANLPVDVDALSGRVAGSVVATIVMAEDDKLLSLDYAANGAIAGFGSSAPISGYEVSDGDLSFSVNQAGYAVNGDATISGIPATLGLMGEIEGEPQLTVGANLSIEDLKKFGFDASSFLGGTIRFAARPMEEGALQITADIEDTSVEVTDLGLSKSRGVPGKVSALVAQDGSKVSVDDLALSFSSVDIQGKLSVDTDSGLESADFSVFKLSPGDDASLDVTPIENGIALKLRGNQLDLKPMLKRYFALDQVSTGGPQSTQFDQALNIDVQLKRAVGFYQVVAYSLGLNMNLVGEDLRKVSMQAQFAENSSVSVATNPTQGGRTMTVAYKDAGTLLRFLNVYPRLLGGQGSLTLAHSTSENIDRGQLEIRDFSIIEEEKVTKILGNHRDSQALIARENRVSFNAGEASFVRRSDRIEIVDAVLDGDAVGGSASGFVYTKKREYDIVGTYVPLFGLSKAFQKIPLLGPIFAGGEGQGLVGVTFAIRGNLDNPSFVINPASLLLPGAFRSLLEFRAREAPREQ